jgi:DNA-binding NtrC family response regulator
VSQGPANILVVHDEEIVRGPLVRALSARGYEVLDADSANEALGVLSTAKIDLVLADVRMPGMDGLELLQRARASAPQLEVMMITGLASVDSAVEAMKSGARDYIMKPFNLEEVILRVERVLKERMLSRENRSLREELKRGYDIGNGARLVVDLSRVGSTMSLGAEVLIPAQGLAPIHGTRIAFAGVRPGLRRVLELSGADRVLALYDVVDVEPISMSFLVRARSGRAVLGTVCNGA